MQKQDGEKMLGRGCGAWALLHIAVPAHCCSFQAALERAERGTGFCAGSFLNLNQGKVFFILPFIPP